LRALLDEFRSPGTKPVTSREVVLTIRISSGDATRSFVTTATVFGTPRDLTVAELATETLYPADGETRRLLIGHV
jgi:hypothetical protein